MSENEYEVMQQISWALQIEWEKFKEKHPHLRECPMALESMKHSFTIGFWSGIKTALNAEIITNLNEVAIKKRVIEEVERGLKLTT
mgnify:CR=1 FL=1